LDEKDISLSLQSEKNIKKEFFEGIEVRIGKNTSNQKFQFLE
jgi:hypothetical protein